MHISTHITLLATRTAIGVFLATLAFAAQAGSLKFNLVPIGEARQSAATVFAVPLPKHSATVTSTFVLRGVNGVVVPATFTPTLVWPDGRAGDASVRSLLVEFAGSAVGEEYDLSWGRSPRVERRFETGRLLPSVTHDADLPPLSLAFAYHAPMETLADYGAYDWIATSMESYGRWVLSEELVSQKGGSLKKREAWLFDRVATLYFVYFATGDLFWKKRAHEAAIFYRSNLDKDGFFKFAPGDVKYVVSHGLLLDHIFYPDIANADAIQKAHRLSWRWSTRIPKRGFWTERHHAFALSNAITHWELTGSPDSRDRVRKFVLSLKHDINASGEYQCLAHSYVSHEGDGKPDLFVCSPWMSALVVEQLWRLFYHLNDYESAALISSLGDYLENYGVYWFAFGRERSAVPMYLSHLGVENQRHEPWSDLNHACDVGVALAKAAYIDRKLRTTSETRLDLLESMMLTCKRAMFRTHDASAWPISPVRKFNWWFNGIASFTWLLDRLLPSGTQ